MTPGISAHLARLAAEAPAAFAQFSDADWRASRGPGKWTRIEIVGHLIDSAVNNHQRIVRALAQPSVEFPSYQQEDHVRVQSFNTADPHAVVDLWSALNRHLAHIAATIPSEKQSTPCAIGPHPPTTLAVLIRDYVAHLEHHLRQILEGRGHALSFSGLPWPPKN